MAYDVVLMADDMKVEDALALGRKARRISAQNIVFSLLVLAVMIPLVLVGIIGVAVTVLVHEGSKLLTVVNGLRAGLFGFFTVAAKGEKKARGQNDWQ